MDDKLCETIRKNFNEKLEVHERRINAHSEKLDRIEIFSSRLEERLDHLVKQLGSLNTIMKWFIGVMIGSFISFFFYAAQRGLIG